MGVDGLGEKGFALLWKPGYRRVGIPSREGVHRIWGRDLDGLLSVRVVYSQGHGTWQAAIQ